MRVRVGCSGRCEESGFSSLVFVLEESGRGGNRYRYGSILIFFGVVLGGTSEYLCNREYLKNNLEY